MRPTERINNFLDKVDWKNLLEEKWKLLIGTCGEESIVNHILGYSTYILIENYWKENPDQRIGQVLINLGILPDNFDIWCDEEEDILLEQGIAPEECLFWTSIYDENENLREKPLTKLIKDLDTNHISKILELFSEDRLSTKYITAFCNVLKSRGVSYHIGDFGRITVISSFPNLKITKVEFEKEQLISEKYHD